MCRAEGANEGRGGEGRGGGLLGVCFVCGVPCVP